jgi:hypothetical protein
MGMSSELRRRSTYHEQAACSKVDKVEKEKN